MSQLGLKSLLVLVMVSFSVINLQAQDRIIKTNQTVLTVKIYEIGEETLRYKPWDRQDGPFFTIAVSGVHKVILESGDELIFNDLEREQATATEGQSVNNSAETESVGEESNASTNAMQEISNALDEVSTSSQQARASVGLEPDQQAQAELNRLNNIKIYWSVFNLDVANSENLGGDGEDTIIGMIDMLGFQTFIPLGGTDTDNDPNLSQGLVLSTTVKYRTLDPPTGIDPMLSESWLVDLGVGYGANIGKDLRVYGSYNLTTYITTTTSFFMADNISTSESLPENSSYIRAGVHWMPIQLPGGFIGLHAAYDTYLAEGAEDAFVIGLSLK